MGGFLGGRFDVLVVFFEEGAEGVTAGTIVTFLIAQVFFFRLYSSTSLTPWPTFKSCSNALVSFPWLSREAITVFLSISIGTLML